MAPINKTSLTFILLLCIACLLSGCGTTRTYHVTTQDNINDLFIDELMQPEIPVESEASVFSLSAEQKEIFKRELRRPKNRSKLEIEVIYEFLQERLSNFNFYSRTLSAEQALAQNAGNCLSLAMLTHALAETTHVGIYYELARTPPVFQRDSGYILSSQHIQTVIYEKNVAHAHFYSSKPLKLKIDYFSTAGSRTLRRVNEEAFKAMYYSNVAAESLIRKQLKNAYWNLKKALQLDPENTIALNLLAVLYQNQGHDLYAQKVFVYGLSLTKNQLELLSNYHRYLTQKNRHVEANKVSDIINDYNEPDPFKWIDIADQALHDGQYQQALNYYKKARRQAPYLHEPDAGLAKTYFFLGQPEQALDAMKQAMLNSHDQTTTALYQAKYNYLKKHRP